MNTDQLFNEVNNLLNDPRGVVVLTSVSVEVWFAEVRIEFEFEPFSTNSEAIPVNKYTFILKNCLKIIIQPNSLIELIKINPSNARSELIELHLGRPNNEEFFTAVSLDCMVDVLYEDINIIKI
jgi:hypothetical protein